MGTESTLRGHARANLARSREHAAVALERHLEAAERMVATLGRMKGRP